MEETPQTDAAGSQTTAATAEAEPKAPAPAPAGTRLCAVKFRDAGRTYDYDAGALELKRGDLVLVDFAETKVVGIVARSKSLTQSSSQSHPKVQRKLDDADKAKLETIAENEERAFKFALLKLRQRNLPAKMVAAELSFNEDKLTFYVASEERIDLRNWIRDVSVEFRARIDVRQIGARDAAKFIGGVGSCGRELCCSTWLVDFRPVSIKMAKDQNLALNPDKVSGQCGRLLCCLTYEQDTYRDMRKGLPKIGKRVYTPMGDGRVKDVNVLRRKIRVQLLEGYEEFDAEQVSPMFGTKGELLQPSFGEARQDFEEEEEEGDDAAVDGVEGAPPAAGAPPPAAQARPPQGPPQGSPAGAPRRDERPGQRFDRPRGPDQRGPDQRDQRGPRPGFDRPRGDRPPGDRPPRDDRPRGDRPFGDQRSEQRRDQRPPREDRPRDDRPRQDRPRQDRPPGEPRPPDQQRQGPPPPQSGPPREGGEGGPGGEGGRRRRRRRGRGGRGGGGGGPGGGGGGGGPPSGGGAPPSGGGSPPPS